MAEVWTLMCKAPTLPPVWLANAAPCQYREEYRPRVAATRRYVLTRMAEAMHRHNSAGHHSGWVGSFQFSLNRSVE